MTPPERYHHGDLPNVLRCTAADLIAEKGLAEFSLREVARRAGVSHTAPAHHFGDAKGLVTAVAVEAFETLRDETAAAAASTADPVERLTAVGRAYVAMSRRHPGHCQVIFRPDVVHEEPELMTAGAEAFAVLQGVVDDLCAATRSSADPLEVALLCWSMVQGIVTLAPTFERLGTTLDHPSPDVDDLVARLTTLVVDGIRAR